MPPEDRTGVVLFVVAVALVAVFGAIKGVNERLVAAAVATASLTPSLSAVPSGLGSFLLLACLAVGSVLLLRAVLGP
ncbi:hypothetical protein SAMN05216278_1244 [Halopelagius longus]|uniref:Uncharacterized protein n=1 Tax=Halopelagius longus TaxID=1236180 RepID=A0A1H1AAT3_9EURY|nr:hypothetical protein SAMN05216278_1244 [Halopelagius longus]